MNVITYAAFKEELEKISGVMEDAHADYQQMLSHHAQHNPKTIAKLHPSEQLAATFLKSPSLASKAKSGLSSLAKHASDSPGKAILHGAADMAGLGALAAPTIQKMRGKEMSERGTHAAEIGGLGLLALPVGHNLYEAGKKLIKKGSVRKLAQGDLWNPHTGEIVGSQMGRANAGIASAGAHAAQAAKKPAFTAAHLAAAKAKMPGGGVYQGIKRGVGAAAHLR